MTSSKQTKPGCPDRLDAQLRPVYVIQAIILTAAAANAVLLGFVLCAGT